MKMPFKYELACIPSVFELYRLQFMIFVLYTLELTITWIVKSAFFIAKKGILLRLHVQECSMENLKLIKEQEDYDYRN